MIEKEDWKNLVDLVSNAKQVVSSVQDVARKLADYANFRSSRDSSGKPTFLQSQKRLCCGTMFAASFNFV